MNRHVRNTDPRTSRMAVPANITAQALRVLHSYRDGRALLDHDAYYLAGYGPNARDGQRCSDLRQGGYIERVMVDGVYLRGKTPSGKAGYLCRITQAGLDRLNGINRGTEMNIAVKPSELVEEYIKLRDEKKQVEEKFAQVMRERYSDRMDVIETQLLDTLNNLGVDSLSSELGTAYKKLSTSVTVSDAREFRRHIIGGENWDLIDWRANKTAVNDLVEKGDPIPPGVNRSAFFTIGIRRK